MKVLLTQNESLIEVNSDLSQNISDYNSEEAGLQKEIMRKEDDLKSLSNREHEWRNEIIALKAQMSGQQKQREDQSSISHYQRNFPTIGETKNQHINTSDQPNNNPQDNKKIASPNQ